MTFTEKVLFNSAKAIILSVLLVVMLSLVALIMAWPLEFTWNLCMPPIFGLRAISFWQAWALQLVAVYLLQRGACSSAIQEAWAAKEKR